MLSFNRALFGEAGAETALLLVTPETQSTELVELFERAAVAEAGAEELLEDLVFALLLDA